MSPAARCRSAGSPERTEGESTITPYLLLYALHDDEDLKLKRP